MSLFRAAAPSARLIGRLLTSLSLGLGLMAAAAPARAYVRYHSDSGCPYGWHKRTIPISAFPSGMTMMMTVEDITTAATRAAGAWSKSDPTLASCTDLDLQMSVRSTDETPPEAKYDGQNNVIFQNLKWPHDARALAITSVFATTWGEIIDADIEVNAVNFMWANLDNPAAVGRQDLQNALTHETGHFIGLDHTCYADTSRPRPNDQDGNPVPDCATVALDDPIRATTMFASADPGDTSKRTLEPDDQQAVCAIYVTGTAEPAGACAAPERSGCAVAPGPMVSTAATAGDGDEQSEIAARRSPWPAAVGVFAFAALLAGASRFRRRNLSRGRR